MDGTWNPAERHLLSARVGADEPAAAMDALLSDWSRTAHARATQAESAALPTWPSLDVMLAPTLAGPFWHRCGYRPLSTNWEIRPAAHLR